MITTLAEGGNSVLPAAVCRVMLGNHGCFVGFCPAQVPVAAPSGRWPPGRRCPWLTLVYRCYWCGCGAATLGLGGLRH